MSHELPIEHEINALQHGIDQLQQTLAEVQKDFGKHLFALYTKRRLAYTEQKIRRLAEQTRRSELRRKKARKQAYLARVALSLVSVIAQTVFTARTPTQNFYSVEEIEDYANKTEKKVLATWKNTNGWKRSHSKVLERLADVWIDPCYNLRKSEIDLKHFMLVLDQLYDKREERAFRERAKEAVNILDRQLTKGGRSTLHKLPKSCDNDDLPKTFNEDAAAKSLQSDKLEHRF